MSSESPRTPADLTTQANGHASQASAGQGDDKRAAADSQPPPQRGHDQAGTDFGPNQWLVDELYQRYQSDPGSVDRAWWNFFADYQPSPVDPGPAQKAPAAPPVLAPAAPARPRTEPRLHPPRLHPPRRPPRGPGRTAGRAPPAAAAPGTVAPPPGAHEARLRGTAARTAQNMTASLSVPTATSVRAMPAKLLIDNRIVINNHLSRGRGGKVSFTHLIGYAVVRALASAPEMNYSYAEADGKPVLVQPEHVNLGLAIDTRKADGTRQLLVPNIKAAEAMDFRQFWMAYEDVVRKARSGKLTVDDFAGTTISLTNPGTIGTEHSVPRLMPGQGTIVGVGAMEYPAAYQGASAETMARLAIGKTITLTSTYDHRIIQGAQSGDFLRLIHRLLLGEDALLRQRVRRAPHPVRADPLGPGHPGRSRGRPEQGRPGARADPRLPGPRPPDGRHRPAGVPPAAAP